jgi:hypothetical protein
MLKTEAQIETITTDFIAAVRSCFLFFRQANLCEDNEIMHFWGGAFQLSKRKPLQDFDRRGRCEFILPFHA